MPPMRRLRAFNPVQAATGTCGFIATNTKYVSKNVRVDVSSNYQLYDPLEQQDALYSGTTRSCKYVDKTTDPALELYTADVDTYI